MAILSDRGAGPLKPSAGRARQAATANGILTGANAAKAPAPTLSPGWRAQNFPSGGGGGSTSRSGGGGGGGGSYGGGGGGGGGGTAPMAMAAPAPAMSEQDYLNSDDVYLAALSRYNKGYDDLLADVTRRDKDYGVTYQNSLDDLGYRPGAEGGPAGWDFENQQSAAGRGFQGLIQDFAARGLLHSGDYLNAQNDFVGSLGKQLDAMNLAKQQFGEGLNQERSSGLSSRDAGIGQARAEALARMQQAYGGV